MMMIMMIDDSKDDNDDNDDDDDDEDGYRILRNKRPGRFWNQNYEKACFYSYFALISPNTSDFSFNSL